MAKNDNKNDAEQKFSEKALKTFVWLRNTQSERQDSEEDLEQANEAEEFDEGGPIIFDSELPCMEIDEDIEEI